MIKKAREQYQLALAFDPGLEETIFFAGTELRVLALADSVPALIETSTGSLVWAVWRALAEDNLLQAEEYAQATLSIDATYVNAHALLARLNLLRDDLAKADERIKLALFLYDGSPIVQLEASRISRWMGDEQESMDHLLSAFELLTNENQSFEFASVFYMRPLLPFDLVPQLLNPKISNTLAKEFTELAAYLSETGDSEIAREILDWIATYPG